MISFKIRLALPRTRLFECRHGLVRLGTVWYRLVRLSAAWYGLVEGFALKLGEANAVNVVQLVFFCFDDNEPLKLALAKLIAINSPNLVWALKSQKRSAQCLILLPTRRFFAWVKRSSAMMP